MHRNEKPPLKGRTLLAAFGLWLAVMVAIVARPAQAGARDAVSPAPIAQELRLDLPGRAPLTAYLLRPAEFRPNGHEVLIYFVGGGQEPRFAKQALGYHVAGEAVRRGYVFVAPAAPCDDCTFAQEGQDYFPSLFQELRRLIPMSNSRFHLMGYSNGGRSALLIATRNSADVASVTVYPGSLPDRRYDYLERLSQTCVSMHVGRRDTLFLAEHRRVARELRRLGHPAYIQEHRQDGHKIDALWTANGARALIDGIENRQGCPS